MNQKILICNRATPLVVEADGKLANDGWVHIVPRGELPNHENGIVQVLDDKSLNAILNHLQNDPGIAATGLYMGEEHFIYDSAKSSQAYAWPRKFEKRADGIWANVEPDMTDVGADALKNKRFKFTSFATDPKTPGAIENLGGNKVRILKIETVGFTNCPNGRDLLAPVTNRNTFPGSRESVDSTKTTPQKAKQMKQVCTLLGLSAEADEASVIAEVTKLKNRLTTLEPLEATNTTLKNRNTELETEQCDVLLDVHGVTDAKARETLKPMLGTMKNRADRVTALVNLGHKAIDPKKPAGTKVLNRGQAEQTPSGGKESGVALTPQQLDGEVRKLMNRDGIKDFTAGFNALAAERPELFAAATE